MVQKTVMAGAGLLALLAGYGVYRSRQRKKDAAPLDSSFIESRLQPDSFFGGTGGQRVDIAWASEHGGGLGLFVRNLVGLDRSAAIDSGSDTLTVDSPAPLLIDVTHVAPCYPYRDQRADETPEAYGQRLAQELDSLRGELTTLRAQTADAEQ